MINVFVPVGPLQYFTDTRQITYATTPTTLSPSREASTLAVRIERVRESSLLSGVDGQAVVMLDLNPSNDIATLEGVERGEPGSRVLVSLGLVKVIGDGDQLRTSEIVGELLAEVGSPSAGSADPGFLQRNHMVLQTHFD